MSVAANLFDSVFAILYNNMEPDTLLLHLFDVDVKQNGTDQIRRIHFQSYCRPQRRLCAKRPNQSNVIRLVFKLLNRKTLLFFALTSVLWDCFMISQELPEIASQSWWLRNVVTHAHTLNYI